MRRMLCTHSLDFFVMVGMGFVMVGMGFVMVVMSHEHG